MQPLSHQEAAIDALSDPADTRAWAGMACGTGKTLVARRAAYRRAGATGGAVLVLAPSKRLTRQHATAWQADTPGGMDTLLVYSDPDGTTDPDVIAAFLAAAHTGRPRVVFATYHSADRVHQAYARYPGLPPVGVMVLDEAHVTASVEGKSWGLVLHDEWIPARARLALTATPKVHTAAADGTEAVASMDNPAVYGQCRYELSFARAIDQYLINDFRLQIVTVPDAELRRVLADDGQEPGDLPSSVLAAQVALAYAVRDLGVRSVLAFHNRVERSRAYTRTLAAVCAALGAPRVTALAMDGDTPPRERDRMLRRLADPAPGTAVVLSSVATITEGVDVPEVDAIEFADPRTQRSAIAQALGRTLRRARHKVGIEQPDEEAEAAVVILPVYLAPGQDPEEILASSRFDVVWGVLGALRDFDGRLDSELAKASMNAVHRSSAPREPVVLPDRVQVVMAGSASLPPELARRLQAALAAHVMTLTRRRVVAHPPVNADLVHDLTRRWATARQAASDGTTPWELVYELAKDISDAVGGIPTNRHVPIRAYPLVGAALDFAARYERNHPTPGTG
jgi:predicted helicase